ncbi:MAG: hypothetical protein K0Q92_418 [Steroidobacteraceae bacterium]|nr:hypothetical protein [Steroidobacteraceae bacterium]
MAGKPHPSDWRNAPASTQRLALLALAGIIGGLLLEFHFSGAMARAVAPTLIARNASGETLLANGSKVFLIDAGEARTSSLSAEDLGLRGPIMSVSSDGRDWYLGDDATGMLYRCDLSARRCSAALKAAQPGDRIFRRAHRVAFGGGRIFVTDSEAHRVLVFKADGSLVGPTRTQPLPLCFPNGIVADGSDLYIADTNNFRIARVALSAPDESETLLRTHAGATIARANCNTRSVDLARRGTPVLNTAIDSANTVKRYARPPARVDRVWPASLLHTSTGEWWVVQMSDGMRDGDVIRYGADGRTLARIELPADADPIELIQAGAAVLISDARLARVHRATLQGKLAGAWGPADFQQQLAAIESEREVQRNLQYLSFGVIAAGVLTALLVVIFELRRQRAEKWSAAGTLAPVSTPAAPLGREPVWVSPDAAFLKRAGRAPWLIAAYTVLCSAVLVYLMADRDLGSPIGRIGAFFTGTLILILVLFTAFIARNVGRLHRRRIGITRDSLSYDPGSGTLVESPWADVRVSRRTLLVGRDLVQIIDPRGRHLYPQAEIESQLLSRLSPSAFVREPRLMFEALRRGNVGLWITAVLFASYLAVQVLRLTQPALVQQATAAFVALFR